ncbi:MAG: adenine phosphoribosyltransferase [Mycobacteriaceae bacterium]|nr:adenine phosphoribosyltransferase [Mycobacteriaceae bacterium]
MTASSDAATLADLITLHTRNVPDFPEPGVQFKDLTPLVADAHAMTVVTGALADIAAGADLVAGIESRGALLAGAVAARLGVGALFIRKKGKLPPPVLGEEYLREYGPAAMEIPAEGLDLQGRSVVIIDDVMALGGTLSAASRLLQRAGLKVARAAVVVELRGFDGRNAIAPLPVYSLSCA